MKNGSMTLAPGHPETRETVDGDITPTILQKGAESELPNNSILGSQSGEKSKSGIGVSCSRLAN